jgi:hypothetical protein
VRPRPLLVVVGAALIASLTAPLVGAQSNVTTGVSGAEKIRLTVKTTATPRNIVVGATVRDRVTISGARDNWRGRVEASVYGPFRSVAKIGCGGTPVSKTAFRASGNGTFTTAPVEVTKPGYYVFQQVYLGDSLHIGFITPCKDPAERFKVDVRPEVTSAVSAPTTTPGASLSARITVGGLMGESVSAQVALYGPFGSRAKISCDGNPFWSATIAKAQDGQYTTAPVTLTVPGYYAYQETVAAGPFSRAVKTKCGDTTETAVVVGTPLLTTQVSSQQTRPDAKITDRVTITGIGALDAQVRVELWGPFARKDRIACTGRPARVASFVAAGDGTYRTAPVTVDRVGYFSYRESIVANEAMSAVITDCGEDSETTLSRAQPVIKTKISKSVVQVGAQLFDQITVRGLGRTPAVLTVELFGPFPSKGSVRCGKLVNRTRIRVAGNGTVSSPAVRVTRPGYYTYRVRSARGTYVSPSSTECGLAAETALVRS